eukprot:764974-Hanusia_phi.AAC.1
MTRSRTSPGALIRPRQHGTRTDNSTGARAKFFSPCYHAMMRQETSDRVRVVCVRQDIRRALRSHPDDKCISAAGQATTGEDGDKQAQGRLNKDTKSMISVQGRNGCCMVLVLSVCHHLTSSLFGITETTRMIPSSEHVIRVSSSTFTMLSTL